MISGLRAMRMRAQEQEASCCGCKECQCKKLEAKIAKLEAENKELKEIAVDAIDGRVKKASKEKAKKLTKK